MIKLCSWTVMLYCFLVLANDECLAIPLTSWKTALTEPPRESRMMPINGTISSLPRLPKTFPVDSTANLFPAARPIPRLTASRPQVFFRSRTDYLPERLPPLPEDAPKKIYDYEEYGEADVYGPAKNKSSTPSGRTRYRAVKDNSNEFLLIGTSAIGGFLGGCITTALMMMTANRKKKSKVVGDNSALPPSLMEALLAISEKGYPITDSPGHHSHIRTDVRDTREYSTRD